MVELDTSRGSISQLPLKVVNKDVLCLSTLPDPHHGGMVETFIKFHNSCYVFVAAHKCQMSYVLHVLLLKPGGQEKG